MREDSSRCGDALLRSNRNRPSRLPLASLLCGVALAFALAAGRPAHANHPGRAIAAMMQAISTTLPYTLVDQPLLRDAVSCESHGRITVDLSSWVERGINGPEVLRMVRSGQVDIGAGSMTLLSGDLPVLEGADLAGMSRDLGQVRRVADAMEPLLDLELARIGVHLLAIYPMSGQMLFCRKPIASMDDLHELRIRSQGPSTADLFRSLGAQPISITFGESYLALERGVIDCGLTGASIGNSSKWHEVSTYLYRPALTWGVAGYYADLQWWRHLDEPTRALLEQRFAEIKAAQWKLAFDSTADGVACNAGDASGCRMHTLAPRPMIETQLPLDVVAAIDRGVREQVLPRWRQRCGVPCTKVYDEVIAPLAGAPRGTGAPAP